MPESRTCAGVRPGVVTDQGTTRFLVGDVRDKGLDAVEQAARVIRSLRQSASSVSDLPEVAKSMTSCLAPFLDDEEFVTALLVDVSDPPYLTLVRCGHPQPKLSTKDGAARPLEVPTGLALALADSYAVVRVPWRHGDRLLMYTGGLSEARDASGVPVAEHAQAASHAFVRRMLQPPPGGMLMNRSSTSCRAAHRPMGAHSSGKRNPASGSRVPAPESRT